MKKLALLFVVACADPVTAPPVVPAPVTKPATAPTPPPKEEAESPAPDPVDPNADPKSCYYDIPQQSCVPGADAVNWACRSDCGGDCGKCQAACKDDACMDTCLRERDRCATKCEGVVAKYNEEWSSNFHCKSKSTPLAICKKVVDCIDACPDKNRDACVMKCKKTHAAGCDSEFMETVDRGSCFPFDNGV